MSSNLQVPTLNTIFLSTSINPLSPRINANFYYHSQFLQLEMIIFSIDPHAYLTSLVAHSIKESACNVEDPGLIPRLGRSPGEGTGNSLQYSWASLVAQMVKNPPAMWETWVGKIPWRRAWQPTPVFLPGESPWTEEPGGLQSTGSQRVRHF